MKIIIFIYTLFSLIIFVNIESVSAESRQDINSHTTERNKKQSNLSGGGSLMNYTASIEDFNSLKIRVSPGKFGKFVVSVNEYVIVEQEEGYFATLEGKNLIKSGTNNIRVSYIPNPGVDSLDELVSFDVELLHPSDPEGMDIKRSAIFLFSDSRKRFKKPPNNIGPLPANIPFDAIFKVKILNAKINFPIEFDKLEPITYDDRRAIMSVYDQVCDALRNGNTEEFLILSSKVIIWAAHEYNEPIDKVSEEYQKEYKTNKLPHKGNIKCLSKSKVTLKKNNNFVELHPVDDSPCVITFYVDEMGTITGIGSMTFCRVLGNWSWIK